LWFQRHFSKQNSVIRLKSNILAPQIFGLATPLVQHQPSLYYKPRQQFLASNHHKIENLLLKVGGQFTYLAKLFRRQRSKYEDFLCCCQVAKASRPLSEGEFAIVCMEEKTGLLCPKNLVVKLATLAGPGGFNVR